MQRRHRARRKRRRISTKRTAQIEMNEREEMQVRRDWRFSLKRQKRLKKLKTQEKLEKLEKRLLRSSRDRRLSCPPRCRSLRSERAVEAMAVAEVMASMAARHPCHLWKTSISLFLRQRTAAVRDGSPSLYLTRWTAAVKIRQQKCQTTTTQAWRNAEEVGKKFSRLNFFGRFIRDELFPTADLRQERTNRTKRPGLIETTK